MSSVLMPPSRMTGDCWGFCCCAGDGDRNNEAGSEETGVPMRDWYDVTAGDIGTFLGDGALATVGRLPGLMLTEIGAGAA
jgi:hypothetical protein